MNSALTQNQIFAEQADLVIFSITLFDYHISPYIIGGDRVARLGGHAELQRGPFRKRHDGGGKDADDRGICHRGNGVAGRQERSVIGQRHAFEGRAAWGRIKRKQRGIDHHQQGNHSDREDEEQRQNAGARSGS